MHIVDSQVHIWGADTPVRPWPADGAHRAQKPYPVTKDMLLAEMDTAGVSRVVIVPPSWEGDRNDLALEAARLHPKRFAVMGRLALERPESRALVADWKKQPGMLGMRLTFHTERQRPWLTDGTADWLWPAAERAGIPLMVLVPGSLDALRGIAERHPGLKLTIDHVGLDRAAKDRSPFADLTKVCALAKLPNVAVKASGMPSLSAHGYPFRDIHPHIRRLVDAFGPRRTFWGTDLTRMTCTYRECVNLFTTELPWLAGADLDWVMGRGVCEWLGWPLPVS
jgi:predicted TIM-barrel fold metal-dependent hydrolase